MTHQPINGAMGSNASSQLSYVLPRLVLVFLFSILSFNSFAGLERDTVSECNPYTLKAPAGAGALGIDTLEWRDLCGGDTVITNPDGTPNTEPTITYTDLCTYRLKYVDFDGVNLIPNGDFEAAPVGAWTDYSDYNSAGMNACVSDGHFYVGTDPTEFWPATTCFGGSQPAAWYQWYDNIPDHTHGDGTGTMFMANGSNDITDTVWTRTANVVAGKEYALLTYVYNFHTAKKNPPKMNFYINGDSVGHLAGTVIGNDGLNDIGVGGWERFYGFWTANVTGTVKIAWLNQQPGGEGNDFAMDDLTLLEVDTLEVTLVKPIVKPEAITHLVDTLILNHDTEDGSLDTTNIDNGSHTGVDDCDGTLDSIVIDTMNFDINDVGDHVVTLIAWKDGLSDTSTTTVTVIFPNDPPVAAEEALAVNEHGSILNNSIINTNSSEPNGDDTTITLLDDVTLGTLDLRVDGTFDYTPPSTNVIAYDTFTYVIADEYGLKDTGYIAIQINPNLPPVAEDSTVIVKEYTSLANEDITHLFTDENKPTLTIDIKTDVNKGTLVPNAAGSFTYTPDEAPGNNDTLYDFFEYYLIDEHGEKDSARISIVIPPNLPPVATPDSMSVAETATIANYDFSGLISDPENDALTTSLKTDVTDGTLTLRNDGTFDYTPNNIADTTYDSFVYYVTDIHDQRDSATIKITILPNFPPIAAPDSMSVEETATIANYDFSGLISDPEGGVIITSLKTDVSDGSLTLRNDGTFDYTPNSTNDTVYDSFVYYVTDDQNQKDSATIKITVIPNHPPTALDTLIFINEYDSITNEDLSHLIGDIDIGDILIISRKTDPTNGVLSNYAGNALTKYVPTPDPATNDTTYDSFMYYVKDNHNEKDSATISIKVIPNLPPTTTNYTYTTEETDSVENDYSPGISDPETDAITYKTAPVIGPTKGSVDINNDGTFKYKPTLGVGETTDSFTYEVCDVHNQCSTGKIYINITDNEPPVTQDYEYTIFDIDSVDVNIFGDMSDPDGDSIYFQTAPLIDPETGNVNITFDGDILYKPADTPTPTRDSFTYEVCDEFGNCTPGKIVIIINPNLPPNLTPYAHTIDDIDVANGDFSAGIVEPEGDDVVINTNPATDATIGSVTILSNGQYSYTPNRTNIAKLDSFEYEVCDTFNNCATEWVRITINPNEPPVAPDYNFAIQITDSVVDEILSGVTDPQNDTIIVTTPVSVAATQGTVTLNADGTFKYKPNPAAGNTTDSFTYQVCDTVGLCDFGKVYITITDNLPPDLLPYAHIINDIDTANGDFSGGINDLENDGVVINTIPATAPTEGNVVIQNDGQYQYIPNRTNTAELDSFEYEVCDTFNNCNTEWVRITINPNNPPIPDTHNFFILITDSVEDNILTNATDPENDAIVASIAASVAPTKGVVSINADGTFKYKPTLALGNTTDSFTYEICDTVGACATAKVYVEITDNLPPITVDSTFTIYDIDSVEADFWGEITDHEGNNFSFSIAPAIAPSKGSVSILANGQIKYNPNRTPIALQDTFEYEVCDEFNNCNTGRVIIIINPNLPPIPFNHTFPTVDVDSVEETLTTNVTDPEGDGMVYNTTPATAPQTGTVTILANGDFKYIPARTDVATQDSFEYEVCDTFNNCSTGKVIINITPNQPPIPQPFIFITPDVDSITSVLTTGVTDPEGDGITYNTTPITAPQKGSVTILPNGDFKYLPNRTLTVVVDSFRYEVCDTFNNCSNEKVTITILPNQAPIVADSAFTTADVDTIRESLLPSSTYDPEGDSLVVTTTLVTAPTKGNATLAADGSFVYEPDRTPVNTTDFFIYEICDEFGNCGQGRVDITIIANLDPIAEDSSFTIQEIDTLREDLMLLVSDPENDPLSISTTPATDVTAGTLTINTDGTYKYAPDPTEVVVNDFFIYTVEDIYGNTATGRIDITVTPNLPPSVLDSTYQVSDTDSLLEIFAASAFITDPEGDNATLNTTPITNTTNGDLTINPDGTFDYNPYETLVDLTDFFEYQVCDVYNNCTIGRIDFNIKAELPPVTRDTLYTILDTEEADEDIKNSVSVTSGAKNIDTTPVTQPKYGTVIINPDGTFNYDPRETTVELLDTFEYNVCSDKGKCATGIIVIRIVPNQPPLVTDTTYVIYDTDVINHTLSNRITEPEGENYLLNTIPTKQVEEGTLYIRMDETFTYTPNDISVLTMDTFSYSVCAPPTKCSTGNIYIEIIPNEPPVTPDYTYYTEDTVAVVNDLLKDVSDPNGDNYTIKTSPDMAPQHGRVTINADGTFTYVPDTLKVVVDSFSYTVCDFRGECNTGTVTIFVAYNPPPVTPAYYYECYMTEFIKDDLKKGLYDPDGSPVILNTTPVTSPKRGTVTINEDGTFTYVPLNSLIAYPDSFHYSACDPDFNCSIGVVYISVDKRPQVSITIDQPLCQGINPIPIGYESSNSEPTIYSFRHDDKLLEQGFVEVIRENIATPGSLSLWLPDDVVPDTYTPYLMLEENTIRAQVMPLPMSILYPPDVLAQKWNNVIAVYEKEYNGGYDFYDFKWLANDKYIDNSAEHKHIDGERGSILHFDPDVPTDTVTEFSCNLRRRRDDKWVKTCPMLMEIRDFTLSEVYPVLLHNQDKLTVKSPYKEGVIKIWDINGQVVHEEPIVMAEQKVIAPNRVGFFMVEVNDGNGNVDFTKIVVK